MADGTQQQISIFVCRAVGQDAASTSGRSEESLDTPTTVLERVGFARNRHYTKVGMLFPDIVCPGPDHRRSRQLDFLKPYMNLDRAAGPGFAGTDAQWRRVQAIAISSCADGSPKPVDFG